MTTARFDRVARVYRWIEAITFGSALHTARTAFVTTAANTRNILIVGEGDGRFLSALRTVNPTATVTVIDASAEMLQLARRRNPEPQTTFLHIDIRAAPLPPSHYDLIVTHFLLDCFTAADAVTVVSRLSGAAKPNAAWLIAEFALPPAAWRRWHAQIWLMTMYFFFRAATQLEARQLPPVDDLLRQANFHKHKSRAWRFGLLTSSRWER